MEGVIYYKGEGPFVEGKGTFDKGKGALVNFNRSIYQSWKGIRGSLFKMEKGHLYVGKRAIIRKEKGGTYQKG